MKMSGTDKAKTPPTGRSKKKAISVRPFSLAEIDIVFRKMCDVHLCTLVPHISVGTEDQINKMSLVPSPRMYFINKKGNTQDPLDKILCKNCPIQTGVILAMSDFFKHKMNPTTIKFENCGLGSTQIEKFQQVIIQTRSIVNVSINSNPNEEQNFYLLLKDTALMVLSLKFCEIDSSGMEKIAMELSNPSGQTLLHLNLASNRLMDEGAKFVAEILRTNRTLLSIDLTDNKISYEGCLPIINALMKFELTHDELITSRRLKFDWYKEKFDEIVSHSPAAEKSDSSTKRSSKSMKGTETPKSKPSVVTDADYHPLIQDCFVENDAVYCKGNNVLSNLNLSYNRISLKVSEALIAMLNYQIDYGIDKGLSRISLQGNKLPSHVLESIVSILAEKRKHPAYVPTSNNHRSKSNTSMKTKHLVSEKNRPSSHQ